MPVLTAAQTYETIVTMYPQAAAFGFSVDHISQGSAVLTLPEQGQSLRPGGTVSGPTLMTLCDTAMWALVLSHIGRVPNTFTTGLQIEFLRRAPPGALIARATLLKLGRSLARGTVSVESSHLDGPVAHATVSYSIPFRQSQGPTMPGPKELP
jgi:uncharacterized protein (TIGR00369 family)